MTNVLVLIVPMVKPVIWQTMAMVMNVQMVGNKDEFSFPLITFLVTYEKLFFFREFISICYIMFFKYFVSFISGLLLLHTMCERWYKWWYKVVQVAQITFNAPALQDLLENDVTQALHPHHSSYHHQLYHH